MNRPVLIPSSLATLAAAAAAPNEEDYVDGFILSQLKICSEDLTSI